LPAYDVQEPFRWIADVAVMEAFESGVLDLPNFYFTGDDYRYRFEIEAKRRFLDLFRERFNLSVKYNCRTLRWDTVIEQKALELSRFLAGRTDTLDFSMPSPVLPRTADTELRKKILSLSHSDAEKLGVGRSTLHYLMKKAKDNQAFKLHHKLQSKLAPQRRSK
jgi:CRISPR-associated protein Cas1